MSDNDIAHLYEHQEPVRTWPERIGWAVLAKCPIPAGGLRIQPVSEVLPLDRAKDALESWQTRWCEPGVEYVIGEIRERLT